MTNVDFLSRQGSVNQEVIPFNLDADEEIPINFNSTTSTQFQSSTLNIIQYDDIENIDWKTAQDEDPNLKIVRNWITTNNPPNKEEQKHLNLELRRYAQVFDKLKIHSTGTVYIQKYNNESYELEDKRTLLPD